MSKIVQASKGKSHADIVLKVVNHPDLMS